MRIKKTPKQTPQSGLSNRSVDREAEERQRLVWETLAPRLLHPSKLALIQLLLQHGQPLTLRKLAEATRITEEDARCQCESMEEAGVLEVVGIARRAGGEGNEPSYFFPKAPQAGVSGPVGDTSAAEGDG
jgi:hypothetical protein